MPYTIIDDNFNFMEINGQKTNIHLRCYVDSPFIGPGAVARSVGSPLGMQAIPRSTATSCTFFH